MAFKNPRPKCLVFVSLNMFDLVSMQLNPEGHWGFLYHKQNLFSMPKKLFSLKTSFLHDNIKEWKKKGRDEVEGKISEDQQWANKRPPQIDSTSKRGKECSRVRQRSGKMFAALENQEDKRKQEGEQGSSFKPRIMKISCAVRLLLFSSADVHA